MGWWNAWAGSLSNHRHWRELADWYARNDAKKFAGLQSNESLRICDGWSFFRARNEVFALTHLADLEPRPASPDSNGTNRYAIYLIGQGIMSRSFCIVALFQFHILLPTLSYMAKSKLQRSETWSRHRWPLAARRPEIRRYVYVTRMSIPIMAHCMGPEYWMWVCVLLLFAENWPIIRPQSFSVGVVRKPQGANQP